MRRNTGGFTLIELLLVMAILGILAVVGFGSFTHSIIKSRDTQRKSGLAQIGKAIELFNNDMGSYPMDNAGVMQCPTFVGGLADCGDTIRAYIKTKEAVYMRNVPSDQTSGRIYYYKQADGGYALYAALENTKDKDWVKTAAGVTTDWDVDCGSTTIKCNYKLTEVGLIRVK